MLQGTAYICFCKARNVSNVNWYITHHVEIENEDRSKHLDRTEDIAIVTVDPPFEINDSTATACIKLSRDLTGDLGGKTCYSTFYAKEESSVKVMYTPLKMINKDKVSIQYLNSFLQIPCSFVCFCSASLPWKKICMKKHLLSGIFVLKNHQKNFVRLILEVP